jgi:hypothetical protein
VPLRVRLSDSLHVHLSAEFQKEAPDRARLRSRVQGGTAAEDITPGARSATARPTNRRHSPGLTIGTPLM